MTGAALAGAAAALALATAVPARPERRWRTRLAAPRRAAASHERELLRGLVAGAGGLGLTLVLAGPLPPAPAVVLGAIAAVGLDSVFRRLEPTAVRRRRERIAADLPATLDLLAACLDSGAAIPTALSTTAGAIGGPVGEILVTVAAALAVGVDPRTAWTLADADPAIAAVGRAVARAVESGAALGDVVTALADDARQSRSVAAAAAARRVGVSAVAPLGVCFLPAFVVVAVVPVVASLASGLNSS
jgi:Flp pilus assembly protein TadB